MDHAASRKNLHWCLGPSTIRRAASWESARSVRRDIQVGRSYNRAFGGVMRSSHDHTYQTYAETNTGTRMASWPSQQPTFLLEANPTHHVWPGTASYRSGIFRNHSSHAVSVGTGLQRVHGFCLSHELWPVKSNWQPLPSPHRPRPRHRQPRLTHIEQPPFLQIHKVPWTRAMGPSKGDGCTGTCSGTHFRPQGPSAS